MVGARPRAFLAALALAAPGAVADDRLVDAVWGDDAPAHPAKALQVVAARARTATSPGAVVRTPHGYRLGLAETDVDTLRLAGLTGLAERSLAGGDATGARDAAREALALAGEPEPAPGALGELRAAAAAQKERAAVVLGTALAAGGDHDAALPLLERAAARRPGDEGVLAALLRSEAAVRGPSAALERYDAHRTRLADRLGTDPGPELQRLHRELIAADRPVRTGVRFDPTDLIGRDDDVRRLRAMVATSRVTSIVGPGGLGKTRLAQVLARRAEEPAVHVVELVGVSDPQDVLGEVGTALGVRDSVTGRRALTPEQRADIRSRIAQQLDGVPTLLVLDNCEHVVDTVADLVAFLVATNRDLTVLTTSRAPLGIAAERVYALAQLGDADAAELFRRRAVAARPDVALDQREVAAVVRRLDGLPLAVELAAAKVRVMSVADIDRRLGDRFALLRGGDRSAPDRHRTLLAVIDWSWNLLGEPERQALRRLSVFHDGFVLDAAEAVVRTAGPGVLDAVASLVEQSLLSVHDAGGSVRYRMLETVREFGRLRLAEAGEAADAERAQREWAVAYCVAACADLHGPRQIAAIDRLWDEEANLADIARRATTLPDAECVVVVMAALADLWRLSGNFARIVAPLNRAVLTVIRDHPLPDALLDPARDVVGAILMTEGIFGGEAIAEAREVLTRLGADSADPRVAAETTFVLAVTAEDVVGPQAFLSLTASPDPRVAALGWQWSCHWKENDGDIHGAIDAAERALALARPEEGPAVTANLHAGLAGMHLQIGDSDAGERYALLALEPLTALRAVDDTHQLRALLAVVAMRRGDLAQAERILDQVERADAPEFGFGGHVVTASGRAELVLAEGHLAEGLRRYRDAHAAAGAFRFPGVAGVPGFEPWTLFSSASCLTAHARYLPADTPPSDAGAVFAAALAATVLAKARTYVGEGAGFLDYPVAGTVLFALAWWHGRHGADADVVARLLLLADGFGYNRALPTMSLEAAVAMRDDVTRRFADLRPAYVGRFGPQLREEAAALLTQL